MTYQSPKSPADICLSFTRAALEKLRRTVSVLFHILTYFSKDEFHCSDPLTSTTLNQNYWLYFLSVIFWLINLSFSVSVHKNLETKVASVQIVKAWKKYPNNRYTPECICSTLCGLAAFIYPLSQPTVESGSRRATLTSTFKTSSANKPRLTSFTAAWP